MSRPQSPYMQFRIGPAYTPPVIKWLLGAHAAGALLAKFAPGAAAFAALTPAALFAGHFYQPISYAFLHADVLGLLFTLLLLWIFGSEIAAHWGARRFLLYLLLCGAGAGLLYATASAFGRAGDESAAHWPALYGFAPCIYGLLLAQWRLWPFRNYNLLFPPITLRPWHFLALFAALDLLGARPLPWLWANLAGALCGYLALWRWGVCGRPSLAPLWRAIRRLYLRLKLLRLKRRARLRVVKPGPGEWLH